MVYRKFLDEKNPENEMELFINIDNRLFIKVGNLNDDVYYNGHITLSKIDVKELIKELNKLIKQMPDE